MRITTSSKRLNRFSSLILICSAAGVALGGTASWANTHQCLQADPPTSQCLSQEPSVEIIKGMSTGLLAGVGAAVGARWQLRQKE